MTLLYSSVLAQCEYRDMKGRLLYVGYEYEASVYIEMLKAQVFISTKSIRVTDVHICMYVCT